jgi:homoserine kinase
LLAATEDRLHQAYRASAMPATLDLVTRLRADGRAAVVSGAGPSVLVLDVLNEAPNPMSAPAGWRVLQLAVAGGVTLRQLCSPWRDYQGAGTSGCPMVLRS